MINAPMLKRLSDQVLAAKKKSLEEGGEPEPFEHDGRLWRYRPDQTTRNLDLVAVEVEIEGHWMGFAYEHTYTPWNIFKPIVVHHVLDALYATKESAQAHLDRAGVTGKLEEDPYADPVAYQIWAGEDIEDVFKLFATRKHGTD